MPARRSSCPIRATPSKGSTCYIVAKEIARRVHAANIQDAELRDQATRAAKSTFLNLCEGLPQASVAMRRKYFRCALGSLNEAVGAADLAEAIGALGTDEAQAIAALAERLRRMLFGLTR